jgi:GT2 family glycosyltransferase
LFAKLPVFRWKMESLRRVPDRITDVPALAGGFLILRAEALEQVGLLDERFFIYLEDIDICKRLREAG